MSRTTIDIIKLVQEALSYHKKYWDDKRPEMQRYRNAYLTEFWKNERYADEMVRVEVSEGYAYIESYISSLFSKAPAASFMTNVSLLKALLGWLLFILMPF